MVTAIRSARSNIPIDRKPLHEGGTEQCLQTPLPYSGGCRPNMAQIARGALRRHLDEVAASKLFAP